MDLEESGGGEELGEVEGGEIVLELYCMRQEYNINKKSLLTSLSKIFKDFLKSYPSFKKKRNC